MTAKGFRCRVSGVRERKTEGGRWEGEEGEKVRSNRDSFQRTEVRKQMTEGGGQIKDIGKPEGGKVRIEEHSA